MKKTKAGDYRVFRLKHFTSPDYFGRSMGYRITRLEPKRGPLAIAEVRVARKHLSPANRIHGGAVCSLADFAAGAVVFMTLGEDEKCATVELKINFIRQVFERERLVCESKMVYRGTRLCVVESKLYTVKGKTKALAAISLSTFNVVPPKPKTLTPPSPPKKARPRSASRRPTRARR